MAQRSPPTKFEVHVGEHTPAEWDRREEAASQGPTAGSMGAAARGRTYRRPALADNGFPWAELGVEPRFLGSETARCVAALQPNVFHRRGADELKRFLDGVAQREETALLVSTVGDDSPLPTPRSALYDYDDSLRLVGDFGTISSRPLPAGAAPHLHPNVVGADRDLGLRLLNSQQTAWWGLDYVDQSPVVPGILAPIEPDNVFVPILVDELDGTLAGVWLPEDRQQRWYVLPTGTDWGLVIRWLVDQAIAEHVPGAFRRVRSAQLVDDELLTPSELKAKEGLAQFEISSAVERARLEAARDVTRGAADAVRYPLLYGSGSELVDAVRSVLESAGFVVEDLDATFGEGRSGDLLASLNGQHWLVENKSAGGRAAENFISDLDRHIATWPELGRTETLAGGVLVVNHQRNEPPLDRGAAVYTRNEFTAALRYPVIPTLALFAWWRDSAFGAIVEAVTGPGRAIVTEL